MDPTRIEHVLEAHRASLLELPGVIGVAQGVSDDLPCIRVFVTDTRAALPHIPRQIEGFRVLVDVTTRFQARDETPGA